jgi:hypothetical protein
VDIPKEFQILNSYAIEIMSGFLMSWASRETWFSLTLLLRDDAVLKGSSDE